MLMDDVEAAAVKICGHQFQVEVQFGHLYKGLFNESFFRHEFSTSDVGLQESCVLGESGRTLRYVTSEVQLTLAEGSLRRLVLGHLTSEEVERLCGQYGEFYEISDYVYPGIKK